MRATGFVASPSDAAPRPLWQSLIGDQPVQVNTRPGQNVIQEIGPFDDAQLVIGQRVERIDIVLRPVPETPVVKKGPEFVEPLSELRPFATFGEFANILPKFVRLVTKWLGAAPSLNRLAFGAILVEEVQDLNDAQRALQLLLPNVAFDPNDGVEDIFWQINRPRQSRVVAEIKINRLMKWSMPEVSVLAIPVVGRAVASGSHVAAKSQAVRVELDINTDAKRQNELPTTDLGKLFEELVELANEIALEGDIP